MRSGSILGIVGVLLSRLLRDAKLYIVLAMLVAILDQYTGSARQVVAQFQFHINGWGSFACLTSYSFLMLWIIAGFLVLLSDVPFTSRLTLFECLRVTPRQAVAARALYILIVSVLYVLVAFGLSCLVQSATLLHPLKWDKALYTMSRGQSVGGIFLRISSVIVMGYTPFGAWCAASGLLALALTLLGLAMLCLSLYLNKRIAICVTSLWAALPFAIGYMSLPDGLIFISPLSWARLELLEYTSFYTSYPSYSYCLGMLFGTTVLLVLLCMLFSSHEKWFSRKFMREDDHA